MATPDDEDSSAATAAALLAARARADRLLREVLRQEEAHGDERPQ